MIKAHGKVKQIKTTEDRRAILLDNDERWFSIFEDTKGLDEAPMIVANIDENLSKGDYVSMEVAKNTKGFWNIRGLEIEKDVTEDMKEETPEDKELFEGQPKQAQANPDYARQAMIVSQSSSKDAIATVALYDLSGSPEDVDAHIDRVWKKYFERTMKLA